MTRWQIYTKKPKLPQKPNFRMSEVLEHVTCGYRDIGVQNADIPPRSVPSPTSSARMPMMASPASSLHQPPQLESDGSELSDDENNVIEVVNVMDDSKCEIDSEFTMSQNVRGRLLTHVAFWRQIGTPAFILSTIIDGYKIPFVNTPPPFQHRNNRSAFDHSAFVTEAILELLQGDRISETILENLHNINPLSVSVQSSGKKRTHPRSKNY